MKEWTVVPDSKPIDPLSNLASVTLNGKILLFGGTDSKQSMYILSEEGELLEDLSYITTTPGYMNQGYFMVIKERIFATGKRWVNFNQSWWVEQFDGNKWFLL